MQAKGDPRSRAETIPCCYYHKEYAIQNFCVSRSCCLPLCPKCIQTHIDEHDRQGTVPLIESFTLVADKVQSSVQSSISRLSEELRSLVDTYIMQDEYSPKSNLTHYAETIGKSREIMFKQLTAFFDNLQLRIEEALKIQNDRLCASGTETVSDQLRKTIYSLEGTQGELGSRNSLPAIIKYVGESRELEVDQLINFIQNKKHIFKESLPVLNINLSDLGSLFSRVIGLELPVLDGDLGHPTLSSGARESSRSRGISPRYLVIEASRRRSPSRNILQIASLENQLRDLRALKSTNISTRRSRY